MIARPTNDSGSTTYVGIDISKATLDVAAPNLQLHVPNTGGGHAELFAAAQQLKAPIHFVCEATGFHGNALVAFLQARRCKVSVLSPFRARQFAKVTGRIAKSDPIDAQMLADFGRILKPAPTPKTTRVQMRLRTVARRRRYLATMLGIQRVQIPELKDKELRRGATTIIATLDGEIKKLNALAAQLIAGCPALEAKRQALCRVVGVGDLSAVQILAELPELGQLDRRTVAAMAGVAPYNRDSGQTTSARHIRGGRPFLRKTLYMAAWSAMQVNPVLAPFYQQLRARGKPFRVAMVAVMRKLLIYLNHIARDATRPPTGRPEVKSAARKSNRRGVEWTAAELEELRRLAAQRVPYKIVAQLLGRPPGSIYGKVANAKIKHGPPSVPAAVE